MDILTILIVGLVFNKDLSKKDYKVLLLSQCSAFIIYINLQSRHLHAHILRHKRDLKLNFTGACTEKAKQRNCEVRL